MQAVAEPAAELRALEAARLDMLWRRAMLVLSRKHIAVSHGRIIYLREPECKHGFEDEGAPVQGEPLLDDGPVLAAIRELRQLSESRRKLFGLDAATVVQVISDDILDAEIRRLTEELDRADTAKAADATAVEGTES